MSIPATSTVKFEGLPEAEAQVNEIIQTLFEATEKIMAIAPGLITSAVDPDTNVTCGFRDNLLACLQVDYIKVPIEQAMGELKAAVNGVLEGFGAPKLP
jgi:hypothetical protein